MSAPTFPTREMIIARLISLTNQASTDIVTAGTLIDATKMLRADADKIAQLERDINELANPMNLVP